MPLPSFSDSINVLGFPQTGGMLGGFGSVGLGNKEGKGNLFNMALANDGGFRGLPAASGALGGLLAPGYDPTQLSPLLGSKGGFDPGVDYGELFGLPIDIAKGAPPQVGAGTKVADVSGMFGGV